MLLIVQLRFPLLDHEKLDIRGMASVLWEKLATDRPVATVKAVMLRLLGVFCEMHPNAMIERMRALLALFMEVLGEEIASNKHELTVMAGALDGMTAVLHRAMGDFRSNGANVRTLYVYITLALQLPKGAPRALTEWARG